MNFVPNLFGEYGPLTPDADSVYTPHWCAEDMVRYFKPTGKILEPCCGDGSFLRYLPEGTEWCEITKGKNFFEWNDPVDWIITNPPFSILKDFISHSLDIADNVLFLLPVKNIFGGYYIIRDFMIRGHRIEAIRWYGTGSKLNFPLGNAIAAIYWKRGHTTGLIRESFYEDDGQ